MQTEGDNTQHLKKKCKQHNCFARKVHWEGRSGAPDWVVISLNKDLFWLELKAEENGTVKDNQAREHRIMRRFGQNVHVLATKAAIDDFFRSYIMPVYTHTEQELCPGQPSQLPRMSRRRSAVTSLK